MRRHGFNLGFIAIVAWIANYLHFTSFGLYEDDWFFAGFPFFVGVKTWLMGSLPDFLIRLKAQGRPLQVLSGYSIAAIGALAHSIAIDYLIAYLLFAASALLMYEVLRHRFDCQVATLSAILFVLTPLHTLHQFLNGEYSWGPAFILLFSGMLLYMRGHRAWSYVFAIPAILGYESVFFLFLGAPFLRRGPLFKRRRREWLVHIIVMAVVVAAYFMARSLIAESRVAGLPNGTALVGSVLYSWLFYSLASFLTYLHAGFRAREATIEGWVYAIPLFVMALRFLHIPTVFKTGAAVTRRAIGNRVLKSAGIALVFLALGYVVSYFFFQSAPRPYMTDRDTRISSAASFGSSLFFAILISGSIRLVPPGTIRFLVRCGGAAFVCMLFLYSFVLQGDYIADWAEQREQAQQLVSLTPDLARDSVIMLKLKSPGATSLILGNRRAIGGEKFMYEQEFHWMCSGGAPWPKLLVVYSDDWTKHLKLEADGFMTWTEPVFDGRWSPATGRFLPGRFIVLEQIASGIIIRNSNPKMVDGNQIVQQLSTSGAQQPSLWNALSRNDIARMFFPGFAYGVW